MSSQSLGLRDLLEKCDQGCCFPCPEALITGSLTQEPAGACRQGPRGALKKLPALPLGRSGSLTRDSYWSPS